MNDQLSKLNCMNYQVHDSDDEYWFAQNGLRSLYAYSKCTDKSFKYICTELLSNGQVIMNDTRDNDNETLCLTMI